MNLQWIGTSGFNKHEIRVYGWIGFDDVCFMGIFADDSAMFWGVKYYNEYLLQAGPDGNVQSDLLFQKNPDFTLKNGWAFPERVYFNGDICVLPAPQDFPSLPSGSSISLDTRLARPLPLLMVLFVSSLVITF